MSVAANEPFESQGTGQEEISQGQETVETQPEGTGINPAWNDLLEALPSSLHSLVTPHLQKWDKNYQEGIGKVHSEYESWKPFQESGIAPEQVSYGLQLLEAIESRPEEIYNALKEYLQIQDAPNSDAEQQQTLEQEQGQQPSIDLASNPEFMQVKQMAEAMAELLVQQNAQQSEEQADQEVEQEFAAAKEKYGDFDEKWVTVQALANDISIDEAASQYQEFVKGILTNANRPGPRVLSGGGSNPSAPINPSQLDDKGRRNMVAQMLANAKANND